MKSLLPPIPVLVVLAGLSQISETLCAPCLPAIQAALGMGKALAECTLSIYIAGFALGVLCWGRWSDHTGRKPGVLAGLCVFALGSLLCGVTESTTLFLFGRFFQGFGSSIGSVLSQAIARDAFQGSALRHVYAVVGMSLSLFPAVGPLLGHALESWIGWRAAFGCGAVWGLGIALWVMKQLPETYHPYQKPRPLSRVAGQLIKDRSVIFAGLIVALCNAPGFSYFSKGSFYVTQTLGQSSAAYSHSFLAVASSAALSGLFTTKVREKVTMKVMFILGRGVLLFGGILGVLGSALVLLQVLSLRQMFYWMVTAQCGITFGSCMLASQAMANALVQYKDCVGTASSFFGFFYYIVLALILTGVGAAQFSSVLIFPLVTLVICVLTYVSVGQYITAQEKKLV